MTTNIGTQSSIAQASDVRGNVTLVREGHPPMQLTSGMEIRSGDVLRSTPSSIAMVSIPGTIGQIASMLEVSSGAEAQLNLERRSGQDGHVVVQRVSPENVGDLALTQDMTGENPAAVIAGDEGADGMTGLVGAGLLAGAGGGLLFPAAGAAAAFVALSDNGGSNTPVDSPQTADPIITPADTAGGLTATVENLSEHLDALTAPVPVVGTLVDTVTDVLAGNGGSDSLIGLSVGGVTNTLLNLSDQFANSTDGVPVIGDAADILHAIITGGNDGGLAGIASGLGMGLDGAVSSTPLAPLGDALSLVLNGGDAIPVEQLSGGLVGGLHLVADNIDGLAAGTPAEPLAHLVADLLGTSGVATPELISTDTLAHTGGLDGLSGLLGGGALNGIPVLGDVVSSLTGVLTGAGGAEATSAMSPLPVVGQLTSIASSASAGSPLGGALDLNHLLHPSI
ncbi:hypothetical protein NQT62_08190 [Limnobacter humi]|uniref:Uncharacterized protein n=1 Tax=Limnobacter humi TaxID=1778671 RepID=A0ABT1WHR5_9BURK|nr:hypothetical protein [Limnobacter humi]MCQ8896408.1 hypothetical protein [Limnobacter humi]